VNSLQIDSVIHGAVGPPLLLSHGGWLNVDLQSDQLYRAAAKPSSRRLVLVAGDLHGTGLLTGPNGTRVGSMILVFLLVHGHAP
jgi:hypothetical protein